MFGSRRLAGRGGGGGCWGRVSEQAAPHNRRWTERHKTVCALTPDQQRSLRNEAGGGLCVPATEARAPAHAPRHTACAAHHSTRQKHKHAEAERERGRPEGWTMGGHMGSDDRTHEEGGSVAQRVSGGEDQRQMDMQRRRQGAGKAYARRV